MAGKCGEMPCDCTEISAGSEKDWLLEQTMGGQWFDLPKDDEARFEILKAAFLKGQWRYADKLSKLKNLVKDL